MFPILDEEIKQRLINDLDIYLADNTQAWGLHADGTYVRLQPSGGESPVSAQLTLLSELAEHS